VDVRERQTNAQVFRFVKGPVHFVTVMLIDTALANLFLKVWYINSHTIGSSLYPSCKFAVHKNFRLCPFFHKVWCHGRRSPISVKLARRHLAVLDFRFSWTLLSHHHQRHMSWTYFADGDCSTARIGFCYPVNPI
jgi:hypothetical protein